MKTRRQQTQQDAQRAAQGRKRARKRRVERAAHRRVMQLWTSPAKWAERRARANIVRDRINQFRRGKGRMR